MLIRRFFLLLCGLSLFAQAQTSTLLSNSGTGAELRTALVVGNSSYPGDAALPNPTNDARLMATVLRAAGFNVTVVENATRQGFLKAVREFTETLRIKGGVGLFYFAGHGFQIKGQNYLVPVDAQLDGPEEAAYDSMDAESILGRMDEAKNRLNLIVLDACRNNPFGRSRSSLVGGFTAMKAPSNSLIAYATAPGSVASDGTLGSNNGLYTQYLARAIALPGIDIYDIFRQVRAGVRRDSGGTQTPWETTSLESNFYFYPHGTSSATDHPVTASVPAPVPTVLQQPPVVVESKQEISPTPLPAPVPTPVVVAALPPSAPTRSESITPLATMSVSPNPVSMSTANDGVMRLGQSWRYDVVHSVAGASTEEVKVTGLNQSWFVLSSGSEINQDGRVRSVKLGTYLVKAVSEDSFLRLPVKAGTSGASTVQVVDQTGKSINARMVWSVVAQSAVTSRLIATIDAVVFVLRYEADFVGSSALPASYESELKHRFSPALSFAVIGKQN